MEKHDAVQHRRLRLLLKVCAYIFDETMRDTEDLKKTKQLQRQSADQIMSLIGDFCGAAAQQGSQKTVNTAFKSGRQREVCVCVDHLKAASVRPAADQFLVCDSKDGPSREGYTDGQAQVCSPCAPGVAAQCIDDQMKI